jgi:hypothetical protein
MGTLVGAIFLKSQLGWSNVVSKQIKAILLVVSASALFVVTATTLLETTLQDFYIFAAVPAAYILYGLSDILHTMQMEK